jgi:hypothetical protein
VLEKLSMKKFKLLGFTNSKDGRDAEFNDWYTNRHLADVVAVPGFVSAQRFKLKDPMGGTPPHQYLAIYEIESDEPKAVMDELMRRSGTPAMVLSEGLDLEGASMGLYEQISPVVEAASTGRKVSGNAQVA